MRMVGKNAIVVAFAWVSTALLFAKFLVFYELHGPPSSSYSMTMMGNHHHHLGFDAPPLPQKTNNLLPPEAPAPTKAEAAKAKFDYSNYTGPSTVYQKFMDPFPCFPGENQLMLTKPIKEGIFFQRPHKVGSTTLTGVVLRLAHTRAEKRGYKRCKHRSNHGTARELDYAHRDKSKSILFSLLRHPESRSMSRVFHFDISIHQNEPTAAYIKSNLLNDVHYMTYLRDLGARNYTGRRLNSQEVHGHVRKKLGFPPDKDLEKWMHTEATKEESRHMQRMFRRISIFGPKVTTHEMIADILEDYNFIAVLERLNESLVAMQMLFGLTTREILYTRSRSAGGYSNGLKNRPCTYLIPRFDPPAIKRFLKSDEWHDIIADDLELYMAAHKSLDRTIDALGREEFNEKLAYFEEALEKATAHCEGRVRTMCTEDGVPIPPPNRTCYIWGEGCDYDCINDLEL